MHRNRAGGGSGHRRYAARMAKGDTGKNYLNELFGLVNRSVEGMLSEFGFVNEKKKPSVTRKPLKDQADEEQPPSKPGGI